MTKLNEEEFSQIGNKQLARIKHLDTAAVAHAYKSEILHIIDRIGVDITGAGFEITQCNKAICGYQETHTLAHHNTKAMGWRLCPRCGNGGDFETVIANWKKRWDEKEASWEAEKQQAADEREQAMRDDETWIKMFAHVHGFLGEKNPILTLDGGSGIIEWRWYEQAHETTKRFKITVLS